jgi:hypothetical protein
MILLQGLSKPSPPWKEEAMSETPETDAAQIFLGFNPDEGDYFVPAEIASELERQRDEAKAEIEKLKEELESHAWTISPAMAQAKIDELVEQRDRLAEVINAATVLIAAKGRHNTMLAYQGLKDALAAVKGGNDE